MHRGLAPMACCALLLAGLLGIQAPTASASGGPGSASLEPAQRLALTAAGNDPAAAAALRVISSDDESVRLAFDLPAITVQDVEIDGERYQVLDIPGGGHRGELGHPMLPTYSRFVQIPDQAGVTIDVIASETLELPEMQPLPMQPGEGGDFAIDRAAYAAAGYGATERALIGEPALARDLRLVPLTIQPVRYDAARRVVEVATRVEVEVRFAGVDVRNTPARRHTIIPRSFDRLYRALVANYTGPGEGQRVGQGAYVIITPNNSSVLASLERLVEWRQRKGWDVYVATTAETGTSRTDIQDWLENAYATWENPPEHVVLIGDTDGSIALPYWTYGSYNGETDHPYTTLAGGDNLADVHLGRISVDSVDRLDLYIEKIVSYESTPYMAETDWYTRACVVGDPSYSGPTCIQIHQWLKERLLEYGYTEVDTIWTSPFVSQMTSKLNRGDTVFSYRGYYHMSGFDTGDIAALQNGRKMSFGTMPTCDTGSFAHGTARSEAWIRAGVTGSNPIPTGGIAAVGTATTGTHTRYNNCMTAGIWRGVFWDEMWEFGAAFTRGKYELYVSYGIGDPGGYVTFASWNNLMGDSGGEMWTGVPQSIAVDHPAQIAVGANAVTVEVTSGGVPLAGALVCLFEDSVTHVRATTGTDGTVDLPVNTPSPGTLLVTVTKHDYHPYLGEIDIDNATQFVGYNAHTIDDDASGTSSGNGDGLANPGEAIELPVQVRNFGTQSASNVTATLTSDDPYVTITDATETFGTIASGATAWSADDFDIAIDGGTPNGHLIQLGMDVVSGGNTWHSLVEIPVVAAAFTYESVTLTGFGTRIDPGESGQISVRVRNTGDATGTGITATLSSQSQWVTVTDPNGSYSNIGVGATGENTGNPFGVSASPDCFQGHLAPMMLHMQFGSGAVDSVLFVLEIGQLSSDDPTGPDGYGYYAFDNTDTGYPYAPTYNWVEIASNYGGPGSSLGLGGDQSRTVDLPFNFVFYGETFDRVTICSNGWMAMGQTYLVNYRNWNIPGAAAPAYMITPMWDNLYPDGQNTVYHWHDAANHRYIVQWSRVRNEQGNTTQNFQAILYDPVHHTTETGDGMIVFQFDTFNNSDYLQHYSTTGIQNGDRSDGVMYQFFNHYGGGAATIGSGRAIKFVALSDQPRGTLTGTVENASNGGSPIEGATVKVIETGETLQTGPDGVYAGGVAVGQYTVEASHFSFEADTAHGVWIIEGQTTEVDFSLVDILGPSFSGTTDYGNTTDTQGPYEIETTMVEYSGVEEVTLRYNANGAGWQTVALESQGGNDYRAEIPGQPHNSMVVYYLYGRDTAGNIQMDPPGGPAEPYTFWVLPPILSADIETAGTGWPHYVVESGFNDQWHVSTARNHTPGGTQSWKFGDTGGGEYTELADGALETEPFTLPDGGTLTFWHWMEAEESSSYPGYAYDGGLLEISIDGGAWQDVAPEGGYTHLIREGGTPGPFPAETPVFSGSFDWKQETVDLSGVTGEVRLRFRFGSDGAVQAEGWYVDDIEVISLDPGFSGAGEIEIIPTRVALHQNLPNPFGAADRGTRIRFDLPQQTAVRLQVFDTSGRLVRTLVDRAMPAGQHQVAWDGRDLESHPVGSGVYFYVLHAGDERHPRRLLVLR